MAESKLEVLFDRLLVAATGKSTFDSLWDHTPTAPTARCSICGTPGADHTGLLECVTVFRVKMADLENDPGYLPAPPVPMPSFQERRDQAFENWLRKPPDVRRRLRWVEPTAEEIRRLTQH